MTELNKCFPISRTVAKFCCEFAVWQSRAQNWPLGLPRWSKSLHLTKALHPHPQFLILHLLNLFKIKYQSQLSVTSVCLAENTALGRWQQKCWAVLLQVWNPGVHQVPGGFTDTGESGQKGLFRVHSWVGSSLPWLGCWNLAVLGELECAGIHVQGCLH